MRLKEILTERTVGVAFDHPRHELIHISQLTRRARTTRFGITLVLAVICGLIAGQLFDGWWALAAVLASCAVIFGFAFMAPEMRTYYDSWQYPESYDMFDDEIIRDRFLTHTEEFTHIKGT